MPLEEDAVRQALGLLTQGISPNAQSLLTSQVGAGNLGERRIGGATSYFDPVSRLPLGAVDDPRSPMGFTIADPNLRNMYSNEMGGTASAVAQNEYMDAFERDKLKNTLAIMQASQHLDPELQQAVMQRLGVNPPGYDQGGGGMGGGPGAGYLGARETGIDPRTGDPIITPMFAQGNPLGGYMSRKLKEELAKLQFEQQLKAPTTAADIELKRQQGQAAIETAGANRGYKEALQSGPANQYRMGLLNAIDNLADKYVKASGGMGVPANPVAQAALKQSMDILTAELQRTSGAAPGAPAAPAGASVGAPPGSETPSMPADVPWWDKGMPSSQTFQPNMAKVAELQRQLAYMQQYAPNDTNMIRALTQKLQAELTPGFSTQSSNEGGVRSVGPGAPEKGITVRKH